MVANMLIELVKLLIIFVLFKIKALVDNYFLWFAELA